MFAMDAPAVGPAFGNVPAVVKEIGLILGSSFEGVRGLSLSVDSPSMAGISRRARAIYARA